MWFRHYHIKISPRIFTNYYHLRIEIHPPIQGKDLRHAVRCTMWKDIEREEEGVVR